MPSHACKGMMLVMAVCDHARGGAVVVHAALALLAGRCALNGVWIPEGKGVQSGHVSTPLGVQGVARLLPCTLRRSRLLTSSPASTQREHQAMSHAAGQRFMWATTNRAAAVCTWISYCFARRKPRRIKCPLL